MHFSQKFRIQTSNAKKFNFAENTLQSKTNYCWQNITQNTNVIFLLKEKFYNLYDIANKLDYGILSRLVLFH